MHKMLSISLKIQPLSNVSEREEWESSTREYEPFKVPREALPNRAWSIYTLLHVTSRYVKNAYLADCSRCPHGLSAFEFQQKKMRSQLLSEVPVGPGGLSARTPRTIRG
jgi:hypothetical protein